VAKFQVRTSNRLGCKMLNQSVGQTTLYKLTTARLNWATGCRRDFFASLCRRNADRAVPTLHYRPVNSRAGGVIRSHRNARQVVDEERNEAESAIHRRRCDAANASHNLKFIL